jgi:hypothetical protein
MNSVKRGHRDEKYESVSTWLDIFSANLLTFLMLDVVRLAYCCLTAVRSLRVPIYPYIFLEAALLEGGRSMFLFNGETV